MGTASKGKRSRLLIHEPERQVTQPRLLFFTLAPIGYCVLLDRAIAMSSYRVTSRNATETSCVLANSFVSSTVQFSNHDDKPTPSQLRLATVPGSLICLMACATVDSPYFFLPSYVATEFSTAVIELFPVACTFVPVAPVQHQNTVPGWSRSRVSPPCRKTFDRHNQKRMTKVNGYGTVPNGVPYSMAITNAIIHAQGD